MDEQPVAGHGLDMTKYGFSCYDVVRQLGCTVGRCGLCGANRGCHSTVTILLLIAIHGVVDEVAENIQTLSGHSRLTHAMYSERWDTGLASAANGGPTQLLEVLRAHVWHPTIRDGRALGPSGTRPARQRL